MGEPTEDKWRYEGAVLRGSHAIVDVWVPIERVGPQRETQRMVTAYCAGVTKRVTTIAAIGSQILAEHSLAVRSYQQQMHHAPNVSFEERTSRHWPIAADLPKDDRELKLYVAWFRATEGAPS
jgi:hypothetical protein